MFLPRMVLCLLVSLLTLNKPALANNAPLRIAVAANFFPVLQQIIPEFEQQQKVKIQLISGATGALYQQIVHGAPFDIFLAADSVRPQLLEQKKLIVTQSRVNYAIGQLALYSASKTSIFTLADLKNLASSKHRFAIANPKIAPYGKAAKASLQYLGLWQTLQPKLITGMNVGQTFQQIRSKAVYAGIVAYSQLKLNHLTGTLLPQQSYPAIAQQLVIVKSTQHPEVANKFVQFLLSTPIQQKIVQYGYLSPHHNQVTGASHDVD